MKLVLTEKLRHEVCIHEAAHAVIHALGGGHVYDIEVAPLGVEEWATEGRKGAALSDLWGVCRTSDPEGVIGLILWSDENGGYTCDRLGYTERLKWVSDGPQSHRIQRELRRMLRAWICGSIAGPMADAIHAGEEKPGEIWLEPENMKGEDLTVSDALSWFLPYRGEFDYLASITESALREPELWGIVLRLADELEKAGCMGCVEETYHRLQELLPEPRRNWPSSPMMWRREELRKHREWKARTA